MGILLTVSGQAGGAFADQGQDIITAGSFDEHTVIVPGVFRARGNGRGSNTIGSDGVLAEGSQIFVPEGTAAFIFNQSGIEHIITQPGGYEYHSGQENIINDSQASSLFKQMMNRMEYAGIPSDSKQIAFVNLSEIRDIKFGTRGPLMYDDLFYGTDLEIFSHGSFTVRITDPVRFVRNFVPANVMRYSFDDPHVRSHLLAEFLQSYAVALTALSTTYRVSQLPAHANEVTHSVLHDASNAGSWANRFGFGITKIGIEGIEFSPQSRKRVKHISERRKNKRSHEDVAQDVANVANGVNGVNDANGAAPQRVAPAGDSTNATDQLSIPLSERMEDLRKLKELLDDGILTQAEFDAKKKQILGL